MALLIRTRKPRDRTEDTFIPDSYFTRFGPDTATIDTYYKPPRITTFADLGREKRRRQAERLERKRSSWATTEVRAIYVWVFHCPGIGGFAYCGWWTYLIGRDWDSGKFLSRDEKTLARLMELFPLVEPTFGGPGEVHREWQQRFVRRFTCRHADGSPRKHAGRIQGKAMLWAEFYADHLKRIIGRAYLPGQR